MLEVEVMSQLLVRDLMSQPAVTVGPTSPLREVIQLMEANNIRHVAVVDSGRLLGLFSPGCAAESGG